MNILYLTSASASGGRTGRVTTEDSTLALDLVTPKELGGPGGDGTNPEQLFASGYAACFLGAIKFVAGRRKLTLGPEASVTATVGIGMRDDGAGFGLDVALSVALPGIDPTLASDLVAEADVVCPYSHLARNELDVRIALAA
jgi:Ohr subfamily peroxiredoxin